MNHPITGDQRLSTNIKRMGLLRVLCAQL